MVDLDILNLFAATFRCNPDAYGKAMTVTGELDGELKTSYPVPLFYSPVCLSTYSDHLNGSHMLSLCLVQEGNVVSYAAIDIDTIATTREKEANRLNKLLKDLDLPLVVCLSRRKGLHVYIFFTSPVPAQKARALLTVYKHILGHPEAEIFPKEDILKSHRLPSRLVIPYSGADKSEMCAIVNTSKLSVSGFLSYVETIKLDAKDLDVLLEKQPDVPVFNAAIDEVKVSEAVKTLQAPPKNLDLISELPVCVVRAMKEKVSDGGRTSLLFNAVVAAKKALPSDTYRSWVYDYNAANCVPPLPHAEVSALINSASKRDYGFKCKEEPAKSMCDASKCKKRAYGISPVDAKQVSLSNAFEITDLVKIASSPPRYEMKVNGKKFSCLGPDFYSFGRFKSLVMDYLTVYVPTVKPAVWELKIFEMVEAAPVIEVPDDAGIEGIICDAFKEYAINAWDVYDQNLKSNPPIGIDRSLLISQHHPIVDIIDDKEHILFIAKSFTSFLELERIKCDRNQMFLALREMGCTFRKISINNKTYAVWVIPVRENDLHILPTYTAKVLPEHEY